MAKKATGEADVLAKIAEMTEGDRAQAERIHALVGEAAPELEPKLWYGQPAYARKGKVVCFFRSGDGDGERYSTFGFSPNAALDEDGGVWPTSYAVDGEISDAAATKLAALIRQAAG